MFVLMDDCLVSIWSALVSFVARGQCGVSYCERQLFRSSSFCGGQKGAMFKCIQIYFCMNASSDFW